MDEFDIIETERIEHAAIKLAAEKVIIKKYSTTNIICYTIEDTNSSHLYVKYYVNSTTMVLYHRLSYSVFIPVSYIISKKLLCNNLVEAVEATLKIFELSSIGDFAIS